MDFWLPDSETAAALRDLIPQQQIQFTLICLESWVNVPQQHLQVSRLRPGPKWGTRMQRWFTCGLKTVIRFTSGSSTRGEEISHEIVILRTIAPLMGHKPLAPDKMMLQQQYPIVPWNGRVLYLSCSPALIHWNIRSLYSLLHGVCLFQLSGSVSHKNVQSLPSTV